jgi:hypothetical protein
MKASIMMVGSLTIISSKLSPSQAFQSSSHLLKNLRSCSKTRCFSSSSNSEKKKDVYNPPPLEDPSSFPDWSYEPRDFFRYELVYQSKISNARVGRIHTPHGIIDTPGYVAVATNGALKGVDFRQADEAGQQLVFCNSYHLLLHPGPEIIEGTSDCLGDCLFSFFQYNMQGVRWAAIVGRFIDQ